MSVALLAAIAFLFAARSASGVTITRVSSPIFYMDTSITPTLQGMYVAYQIHNNGGINYPDVWVGLDSFTGVTISLAPGEDGIMHLGSLGPGQTKTAFFYLQANSATTTPQSHTVRVFPSRPPASELASASFTMTSVEETIQANANKVVTVVTGPNPPELGGIVTMTVSGDGGTIGAARIMSFSPAAYLSWRPDAYEMISSEINLSGGNSGTYNDTLHFTVASSSATEYVAVYRFRTVNTTTTPTTISPIAYISSGNVIKHTTTGNYGSLGVILPADNRLVLGKAADPNQVIGPGQVTFTLTATNTGSYDAILEDFIDTLPNTPGNPTYVSGTSRFNGLPIADPSVAGSTLTWISTFNLPAGASRALTFQVNMPATTGTYTNRAVAHIGGAQIDTTLITSDNAPAVATVLVRPTETPLNGNVFNDNGAGGGLANDGMINGAEAGIEGVTVRLTDAAGGVIYDSATTDVNGNYALSVPGTLPPGTPLNIVEVNPVGYLSTGGSPGNSGGTYDRGTDTLSFTLGLITYSGINFGDVQENGFLNDSQQTGLPGSFVVHPHTYIANSAGQLSFSLINTANPSIPGWNPIIYVDANCNGQIDVGEQTISGPTNLNAGDRVCILVRDAIPANAPFNAQNQIAITASFNYIGANPALNRTASRTALTIVGNPTTAGLTLAKSVDKPTALPGETILYTVTYANNSNEPLDNIVIYDSTPAFTTFLSAPAPALPPNLTAVSVSTPTVGSAGPIQWTFTGTLGPSQSGTVTFSVLLTP